MNPIQLNYSGIKFGGFHELSIDLNKDRIKVEYYVADKNKAAYEKHLELGEFMQNVTKGHLNELKEFYLSGDGEINWNKLATINYYEDQSEGYYFFFELKDVDNKKLTISGQSSTPQKDGLLKDNYSKKNYTDILDAPQSTQKKEVFEKKYIKEAYTKIIAVLVPIASDQIFENYLSRLEKEEKIKFGAIEIESHGIYLKKPGWLFSKKVLIPWHQIKVTHEKHRSLITDELNPKTKLSIPNRKFINKAIFPKIVAWGKQ